MNTTAVNEHGWSMIEKGGRPLLARRHTLTIEGEEIGTFELAIACSANVSNYTATYTETRKRPGNKRTAVALKDVSARIERGEIATALFVFAISISVGVLNAACMSA